MIAYACTPARGGEHLLGWEWATRLSISHDVTVLTSADRLKESDGQRPASLRMLPVPDSFIRPLKRMGLLGWHLYYRIWHVAAARLGRRLLAQERFDIVHQCTFHTECRADFREVCRHSFGGRLLGWSRFRSG